MGISLEETERIEKSRGERGARGEVVGVTGGWLGWWRHEGEGERKSGEKEVKTKT